MYSFAAESGFYFESCALAVLEALLRCTNALTCQSQLNLVGQEIQFLVLPQPRHNFCWYPVWISRSRRLLLTLFLFSFLPVFLFCFWVLSNTWFWLVSAQSVHYFPSASWDLVLWSGGVVIYHDDRHLLGQEKEKNLWSVPWYAHVKKIFCTH